MSRIGIFLGRFNPLHLGHQEIITKILKKNEDHLIIIGSAQEGGTLRNPFTLEQRKSMLRVIYPTLNIAWGNDVPGNNSIWLQLMLNQIMKHTGTTEIAAEHDWEDEDKCYPVFYGGSTEDLAFAYPFRTKIFNRYRSGVSSSEVKDALITDKSLGSLVDPRLQKPMKTMFNKWWKGNRYGS